MTGRRREPVRAGAPPAPSRALDRAFTWYHATVDLNTWYRVPAVAAAGPETFDGD